MIAMKSLSFTVISAAATSCEKDLHDCMANSTALSKIVILLSSIAGLLTFLIDFYNSQ